MSTNNQGRENFLKWLRERREGWIKESAEKYAKLPENIRAAIARVAGVENVRLDELSAADRKKLFDSCKELRVKIDRAFVLLMAAHTMLE